MHDMCSHPPSTHREGREARIAARLGFTDVTGPLGSRASPLSTAARRLTAAGGKAVEGRRSMFWQMLPAISGSRGAAVQHPRRKPVRLASESRAVFSSTDSRSDAMSARFQKGKDVIGAVAAEPCPGFYNTKIAYLGIPFPAARPSFQGSFCRPYTGVVFSFLPSLYPLLACSSARSIAPVPLPVIPWAFPELAR